VFTNGTITVGTCTFFLFAFFVRSSVHASFTSHALFFAVVRTIDTNSWFSLGVGFTDTFLEFTNGSIQVVSWAASETFFLAVFVAIDSDGWETAGAFAYFSGTRFCCWIENITWVAFDTVLRIVLAALFSKSGGTARTNASVDFTGVITLCSIAGVTGSTEVVSVR